MYRRFIATVAAASIAITALGTAPARAENHDLERALAAILGIAVLGAIINDNKKDDYVVQQHRPRHAHNPRPRYQQPRYNQPRYQQPRHAQPRLQPKPLPHRVKPRHDRRNLLPGHCLRTFATRRGNYQGFARACLMNNYAFTNRLPNRCLTQLRTQQGKRHVFEARCLRNAGYRLARL